MSEEVILTKSNVVLTKAQSDILSTFQGIDMSKIQQVDMTPSWVKNMGNVQNVKVLTSEERAKPITDRLDREIEILESQLQQAESTNTELQDKLDKSNFELKQLNDKVSSQTYYIKELKADLKEETERRIKAEDKLSSKDWKLALISFAVGVGSGLLVAWITWVLTN